MTRDKFIEKICRELCEVDGNDPDLLVTDCPPQHGSGLLRSLRVKDGDSAFAPAWFRYWLLAEKAADLGAGIPEETAKKIQDDHAAQAMLDHKAAAKG